MTKRTHIPLIVDTLNMKLVACSNSDIGHPSYQPITQDGGIVKTTITAPTKQNQIVWRKGINAKIHFKVTTAPFETPQRNTANRMKDAISPSPHQRDQQCCNHGTKSHMNPLANTKGSVWQNAPVYTSSSEITYAYNPDHDIKILADTQQYDNHPFDLRIGRQFGFAALESSVRSMRVGETAKFLVFPEYTNGFVQLETQLRRIRAANVAKKNNLPIPSNCCMGQFKAHQADNDKNKDLYDCNDLPLEVQVSLLSVEIPDKDFMPDAWELSLEDKCNRVASLKETASQHFSANEHELARKIYTKALEYLESIQCHFVNGSNSTQPLNFQIPPNVVDINCLDKNWISSTLLSLHSNIALCSLKLGHYQACVTQCTQILETNPDDVKARFRRALAHLRRGRDLELAKSDLEWLVNGNLNKKGMSRSDAEWANAFLELETKIRAAKKTETALWQNVFDAKKV